jgi:hypothetical protein
MKKNTNKTGKKKTLLKAAGPALPTLAEWGDLEVKKQVFQEVIGDILMNSTLGDQYVASDDDAKAAFVAKKKIKVPDDIKIVFLRAGDSDTPGGGSIIIQLPEPKTNPNMPDDEKLELFLCTYNPW